MEPGNYQPFLIGEGKSTTGYFTYLDSWVKPDTAYDTLVNAYVYRGSLYQRNGFTLFPSDPGNGALVYADSIVGATGNGSNARGGTLPKIPVIVGGFKVRTLLSSGVVETWNDPLGNGTLVGDQGDSGAINYTTGVWSISTATSATTIAVGVQVWVTYSYVATDHATNNPIMGIAQFINETTNTNVLVVMDTRRASYWDGGTKSFTALNTFSQPLFQFPDPNAISAPPHTPIDIGWTNIAPFSVIVSDGTNTMVDNGLGGFIVTAGTGFKVGAGGSSIVYSTGLMTLVYNSAPADLTFVTISGTLAGDYFTGNNTNFFNYTNWDAPDVPAFLYMTNNVDRITLFNGSLLSRPAFALYADSTSIKEPSQVLLPYRNDVATCLDIKVFQNALLLLRPKIYNDDNSHSLRNFAENQAIYWSSFNGADSFSPTNFVQDIAGNGGFRSASTGDILMASELLRDVLVVFFTNSTWIFRFTNASTPAEAFRFYQLNVSRSTNAPYGTAPYDVTASSMGAKGLIQCDGVGVERYDEKVIDLFQDINQNSFGQCFAQKYDAQNQTWMLYPSVSTNESTSDSIMVYNYLEDTWAIYKPNLGVNLSCLGLGFTTKDATWNDLGPGGIYGGPNGLTWQEAAFQWNKFVEQDLSPSLLAGDQNGFVYIADNGPTDNLGPASTTPNPIPAQVITKRLNPFIGGGVKTRFGALDIYYETNPGSQISLNVYANNSNVVYRHFTFSLDTPGGSAQAYGWKRFYLNVTSEFVQIEFNSLIDVVDNVPQYNPGSPFKILGMILWAYPAGRLTPGTFL
jgi:hypothetical protein